MKENWWFQRSLRKKLKQIIQQGHYTEYQKLFNLIVELHREEFTEENIPTARGELEDLLNHAIERIVMIENLQSEKSMHHMQADALEKKISEVERT